MKLRVYLGGPITGYNEQERREAFARKAAELANWSEDWGEAWDIINPFHIYDRMKREIMDAGQWPKEPSYAEILQKDIDVLKTCHGAYYMRGYEMSNGCRAELATIQELPVCYNGDYEQVRQFHQNMVEKMLNEELKKVKEG